ncbi:DUF6950 family protein [Bradyrhizobium sp. BR 1433]|uniref:DUF6950 family protein n=1 Tax=Bradyrhizobium sp. BR 1433 TaxID=3447967 RepID=UPI003EE4E3F8
MAGFLMTDIEAMVADYLDGVASQRFGYGVLDCCTLMADWVVRCGWPDPMADRRGGYSTFRQYRAAMRREGWIVRSCSRRFAAIGLSETASPQLGDVCLVTAPVVGRARDLRRALRRGRPLTGVTGAIYLAEGLRALVSTNAGLVMADLPVLRAWRVSRA